MKKLLLITGFAVSLMASAQIPGGPAKQPITTPADQNAIELRMKTTARGNTANAAVTGPNWFEMSEAVRNLQGGANTDYSYMTIFPDTNAYISYSASGGGATVTTNTINSVGLVFDPRGAVWKEMGPFQTSRWNTYTVDSLRFQFFYRRFNSDANQVDTLYVTTFDKTSLNRGFTSIYAAAVDYTRNKYTVKGTNANTQVVLLTPADTVGGSRSIKLPVLGTKTISGANTGSNWFGASITYVPGYKGYNHGAPWDTIAFYNSGAKYDDTKVCNMFRLLSYFDPGQYTEDANVPATINGYRIYNHGIQAQEEARYGLKSGTTTIDYYFPSFYQSTNGFPAIDFLVSAEGLGVDKINGTGLGTAYPNPTAAGTDLHVPFKLTNSGNVEVRLINMNGQVVRTISKSFNAGVNEVTFNVNGLSAGMYTYSLTTADFSGAGKIMIK